MVEKWVNTLGQKNPIHHGGHFEKENICGFVLELLTVSMLRDVLEVKTLGHRLLILKSIQNLDLHVPKEQVTVFVFVFVFLHFENFFSSNQSLT